MFALFYVYVLKIKINIVMKRKILTLLLAIVASVEIHAEIIYIVEGDLSYKLNTQSKVVEVEKYRGLSPVGVIEILPSVTYKNVTYNVGFTGTLGNILWIIFFGWETALTNLALGLVLCLTIIGIPFGKQFFKLAAVTFMPFGAEVTVEHVL